MRQTRSKAKSEAQSSDSGPPAETRTVWQWQGDQEEQWEAYPDSSCRELDSALAAGTSSFTLSLESGYEYSIDLHNMLQINPVTKYKRKIRSQRVKTGRRREEEEEERGEWRREGGEREEEGYEYSIDLDNMLQINPVTKYKRKIRSQRVKTGRRREEEEEEEGREGGGERRRRREEEEEERGRREGREREEEGYEYSIDLHNMLQINPVTKYKRKIRSQAVKTETTATNVKEEETEKPPAAKKQKGQSKKQTKAEETMATNVKEEETEKPPAAKKQKGQSKKQTKAEETMATNVKEEKPPAAKKQKGQSKKQTKAEETTATNVKEEETEKPPTAKKQKGQNKKQTKAAPKEVKAEETVKTVVMKGKAPVDSECTTKLGKAHVFSEGDDVYDVMLNQTNLQFNNNKYYLIQLLEDDSSKSYSVWMRWGRVGKVGQNSLVSCGEDLAKAKKIFLKKFEDKTDNDWDFREFFEKVPGKYDLLFVDYKVNNKEVIRAEKVVQRKQSSLDPRVQSLLELICDLKAMEQCVLEMKFDTRKAPLGKLTPEQIRAGFRALRTIEDCLRRKGRKDELTDACNQFYTRIPHDFGLKTPPIIRTEDELKEKIKLLEALSDIQIAVKMVESSSGGDENLLDQRYKSLNCGLQPLEASAHEYQVIERYLQSTHASTHGDYTMTLLDVFSVDRADENQNLRHLHNRTLLWHGSRLTNWVGILSRGLRVAPPEAPVTGYMFGKGIYFADMSSKSGNYCFTSRQNNVGLLLLCEVALGDTNDLLVADYEAEKLPPGKHSTKGLGRSTPDPRNAVTLDGMTVPMGPGVPAGVPAGASHSRGFSLLYNEFIVYDPSQARMRFLLRVRFNYSSLW